MSDSKFDAATILKILNAIIDLKDAIANEISKEVDASKRKKYNDAIDKVFADPTPGNILAFRELLFKV